MYTEESFFPKSKPPKRVSRKSVGSTTVIRGNLKNKKIPLPASAFGKSEFTSQQFKESAFQIIDNHFPNLNEVEFIDGFCGSGQMGIEALSRNFANVLFLDRSHDRVDSTRKYIQENYTPSNYAVKVCNTVGNLSTILELYQETFAIDSLSQKNFVIFLDPPYEEYLKKPFLMKKIFEKLNPQFTILNLSQVLLCIQAPTVKAKVFQHKKQMIAYKEALEEVTPQFDKIYSYGKNLLLTFFDDNELV